MATGIQTGMRTGTAPVTGRGAAPGGGSPVQKIMQSFNAMSPKQKLIGGIVLGVLLVAIISFSLYSKSTEYVSLYDTPLSQTDVKQITDKLTEMNIPYKTSEGAKEIMVPPSVRNRAKMQLAQYGLPLRKLATGKDDNAMAPKTPKQLEDAKIASLEADLTESVRQIEGVADAYVKIVIPKDDFFAEEKNPTTASVMVRLQPGIRLTVPQVKGLVHLIAFSVEGLEPKNVKVVDTQGFILSDPVALLENENDPSVMSSQQTEKKVAYEKELQNKVQSMLDQTLGPNKAKVAVNATLDFSTRVTESKVVGGVGNTSGEVTTKLKTIKEQYGAEKPAASDNGVTQMSFKGSTGDVNPNYSKTETVAIKTANEKVVKTSTPAGTLQRLTASVLVDNLKQDQVEMIKGIVKDTIGIDESRGDSITVASMPFSRGDSTFTSMREAMANRQVAPAPAVAVKGFTPAVAGAAVVVLFILALVYVLRQNSARMDKSKLILTTSNATATSSDISDLVSDKIGRSTLPAETKVNTSDQLEQLAKEKPTKVAELLKSTWLADKER